MNSHLHSIFYEAGRVIFSDLQNFKREVVRSAFKKTSENDDFVQFWNNVNSFFENNDVLSGLYKDVPCSFINDSTSAGRHRQHCYIKDFKNNVFQIDVLTHRNKFSNQNDSLPLGSIAEAMLKKDISGIDDWFNDYNDFINKKFISGLKSLLDDINSMPYLAISIVQDFYSTFFFWNVYSSVKKFDDYKYSGILDLENLMIISSDIKESNLEEFKLEVKKLINK